MSCCAAASLSHQVSAKAIDPTDFDEAQLRQSAQPVDNGLMQISFTVPDIHCVACIRKIERGISELPQVKHVRANLSLKRVTVIWDPAKGRVSTIDQALTDLGFDHSIFDYDDTSNNSDDKRSKELLLALAVAGFAAANVMLLSVSVWSGANDETAQLFHLISGLIAAPTVLFSGRPFFKSAWSALRVKRLNMDVPISLAVVLALFMSVYESLRGGHEAYFDAAVTLLFFLLIGRYLDHLMRQKARGAVEQLSRLASKGSILIDEEGQASYIPLSEIEKGMTLRIKPGERFPVDGEIITGATDIDRSLVTGESDSVSISVGETVEAGALNLTGAIDINTISTAQDSFLAEMRKMMEVAENGRSQYVRIADRMAQIYAPAVHLLALITFIGWMVVSGGNFHASIYTAIAVLIITCPCALGLAVPVAHVIGANRLMKQGILMRDGSALERLAEVDTVVFDKTGTLTSGKPVIQNVIGLEASQLGAIKTMAQASSHPFAKAINEYYASKNSSRLEDIKEVPGFGVEASYKGQTMRFGKLSWVSENTPNDEMQTSNSSVAFAVEGKTPTIFELEDSLRDGALQSMEALKQENLELKILSGDKMKPVVKVAQVLGIESYLANQTPAEKINALDALKKEGKKALMVGDGLNDAPALASAHASMAPASASDVGRMASDFIFTRPSLIAVASAQTTAKTVGRIIKQNFGIAIAYNCVAIPMAMGGYVTPLIAALAMSGSSIAVIANSMRINLASEPSAMKTEPEIQNTSMILEAKPS